MDNDITKWRRGDDNEDETTSPSDIWTRSSIGSKRRRAGRQDQTQMKTAGTSMATPQKKKKSSGVSPESFHKPLHKLSSSIPSTTNAGSGSKPAADSADSRRRMGASSATVEYEERLRKTLRSIGTSVDYRDLAGRYERFKNQSTYSEFPIQEPALRALDDLITKWNTKLKSKEQQGQENENENNKASSQKAHHIQPSNFNSYEDQVDSDADPMWSLEPRIFAIEKSATGKRKYIVTALGRFMHHYWRFCEPSSRHYYELIREETPCRLYFDLEYNKKANPGITNETNEALINEFISELSAEIHSQFNISMKRRHVFDLDSSTDKKFSRHLICHFPNGELFADAVSCGDFVKIFVGQLAEGVATKTLEEKCPTLAKYLFINSKEESSSTLPVVEIGTGTVVETPITKCGISHEILVSQAPNKESQSKHEISANSDVHISGDEPSEESNKELSPSKDERKDENEDGIEKNHQEETQHNPSRHHAYDQNKTCFVDTGVYTRNRLFRLLGSSKFGKPPSAALRVAAANTFKFSDTALTGSSDSNDIDKLFNWCNRAASLVQSLVTPAVNETYVDGEGELKILKIKITDEATVGNDRVPLTGRHGRAKPRGPINTKRYGPSPFPLLDEFVNENLAKRKGVKGAMREWAILSSERDDFDNDATITYQIKGNRWCENIQRCHKSNNVMWSVSLRDMNYWQTCWDPDCRMASFRGLVQEVPYDIKKEIERVSLDEAIRIDGDFEDALASFPMPDLANVKYTHTVENKEIKHSSTYDSVISEIEDSDFETALNQAITSQPDLFP